MITVQHERLRASVAHRGMGEVRPSVAYFPARFTRYCVSSGTGRPVVSRLTSTSEKRMPEKPAQEIAREDGVVIELDGGQITLSAAAIDSIVPAPT